jgi:hypothetical protein
VVATSCGIWSLHNFITSVICTSDSSLVSIPEQSVILLPISQRRNCPSALCYSWPRDCTWTENKPACPVKPCDRKHPASICDVLSTCRCTILYFNLYILHSYCPQPLKKKRTKMSLYVSEMPGFASSYWTTPSDQTFLRIPHNTILLRVL